MAGTCLCHAHTLYPCFHIRMLVNPFLLISMFTLFPIQIAKITRSRIRLYLQKKTIVSFMYRVISNKISMTIDRISTCDFDENVRGRHPMTAFQSPETPPSRAGKKSLLRMRLRHVDDLDRWWAAAPPVPEWWSETEINEAPAKCSQITWATAAPSQAPAPQKSVGNT